MEDFSGPHSQVPAPVEHGEGVLTENILRGLQTLNSSPGRTQDIYWWVPLHTWGYST